MVARAEEAPGSSIPHRKGEIAPQVLGASVAPDAVGVQDQLGVGSVGGHAGPARRELVRERRATVQPRVGHDPHRAVQGGGLALALGLPGRPEHGVAQAHAVPEPDVLLQADAGHVDVAAPVEHVDVGLAVLVQVADVLPVLALG